MTRRESSSEVEIDALLERGRAVPRLPAEVRTRVLARARATAQAAPPLRAFALNDLAQPRRALRTFALAAAFALGLAGVVFAFSGRWSRPTAPARHALASAPSPRALPPLPSASPSSKPPPNEAAAPPQPTSSALRFTPRRSGQSPPAQESYAAELDLMRRAHSAYAAGNFAASLTFIAEHARRFPRGLLAEEREALRVQSLAGSGRANEARQAAAAFAARFPRSVLLPRIQAVGSAHQ